MLLRFWRLRGRELTLFCIFQSGIITLLQSLFYRIRKPTLSHRTFGLLVSRYLGFDGDRSLLLQIIHDLGESALPHSADDIHATLDPCATVGVSSALLTSVPADADPVPSTDKAFEPSEPIPPHYSSERQRYRRPGKAADEALGACTTMRSAASRSLRHCGSTT